MKADGHILPASPDIPIDLQVQRRLGDIGRLVSLPQTTFRLLSLLMDEDTSAKDLQAVIEIDPALTAKILSLSNSPIYATREPVSTVQRAITIIGFNELEVLAMGMGLAETFDIRKVPAGFDSQALWLHCLAVAWISRELAAVTGAADPGEAMIAGILHELGTLILISKFPVNFQQILDLINSGMNLRTAETTLSLRHEVIGYHLARNWSLPEVFQNVILYHHDPERAGAFQKAASIVALADNLAHKTGYELKIENLEINLPVILKILSFSVDRLQIFVKKVLENIVKVEPLWGEMVNISKPSARKEGSSLTSIMNKRN
ncbi:MAG: HDOD domain-containing protein [Deltaproteobacteria bacterium]|jgi:HD-like signal output (HDOD) protein|nr:HDOD domain-containing protein [Deltaproteobacteria bacterium]